MNQQRRRNRRSYRTLAFALPCAGMLLVMLISQYAPFGKYSMLYSDMYHQYYPFFVEFRRAIRSGTGLLYTWSVGMGMDYLGLIAYYLASPLNLLSVLVPEEWLLGYFSLLVPVKLGLAGLFFTIFLEKMFHRRDISTAIFGAFYGLCAWALGFQWNVMWLDTFALLPLVVVGVVSLLQEKKFLLYTLTLFLSIFCNYYIGLFTCIFVFLLFFVYEFCRWGGFRKFVGDLLRIAFFSAIAIGLTAVLTLPALGALQTTQSSVNSFPTGFRLNIASSHDLKGLLDAMRQVAGNMGGAIKPNFKEGLPNVYCGIVSVMLMFLYLMDGKTRLRDKICGVVLLLFFNVSFIIRQLDYIWHGFHFTNMIPYRFSFLYSFVVLYMAYRAWTVRESFGVWRILAAGILAAGVLACSESLMDTVPLELGSTTMDFPLYFVYNLLFLALYVLSMLSGVVAVQELPEDADEDQTELLLADQARQRRRAAFLVLAVMLVEMTANLICFGMYFTGTGISNYPKGTTYTASVIRYMHERERRNLFFRAETTHSQTLNDGALNGYNGVSAFTSSANVKTTLFMQSLGYGAKNTYNRYLFEESSPVANLFLGLKYMIERDGKDKSSSFFQEVNRFGDTVLLENQAYLPLGFLAEMELAEMTFSTSDDPFVLQNKLFAAATGVGGDVWQPMNRVSITSSGVDVTDINGGFCRYSNAEARSEIYYTFTADRDGFVCVHLDLPKRNDFYVSLNGIELYKETISLPQMLAVGDVKAGDTVQLRIVCDAGENSTMTVGAAALDRAVFDEGYALLSSAPWELTGFTGTRVEGTVECDRAGLLYTSIPQNGNWNVTVDGWQGKVRLVGDCMIGVELTPGTHNVVFTYKNAAFDAGLKISFGCLLVLILLSWATRISAPRQRRRGRFQSR